MLNKVFKVLGFIFARFIVYGGVQHFLEAEFYSPFVPSVFPFAMPIIYLSGILEVVFGVAYFIPKYRLIGAWGIFILMVVFLPIHLADVFIDAPAIGSKTAAYVRLPVQFLFIVLSWKMVDMAKKSQ